MRQQVADRGAGRAGRGVQLDDPFLDGDVRGPGHQRLGDRRQLEDPPGVAVAGQHSAGSDDRGGGGRNRPVGYGVQGVKGGHHFLAM